MSLLEICNSHYGNLTQSHELQENNLKNRNLTAPNKAKSDRLIMAIAFKNSQKTFVNSL
ncbi:MAG: hypothetical protein WBA07_23295 [Rivularia sp. (in: cyanobacteria)]